MRTLTAVAPPRIKKQPKVVSGIEIGTMALGDHYGVLDEQGAVSIIQEAMERGARSFDTCPAFGQGASELLLARALESEVDNVSIATKALSPGDNPFQPLRRTARERLLRDIEGSLRRLGRHYIDLYYIYGDRDGQVFDQAVDALLEIRESGLIRATGIYSTSSYFIRRALRRGHIDAVMVPYSILNRPLDTDFLSFCRGADVAVHACEPLFRGLLAGSLHRNSTFPEGDVRTTDKRFRGERFRKNIGVIEPLKQFADREGMTLLELSLGWVLQHPAIKTAVCGARNREQVAEIIAASTTRLTLDQILEIDFIIGSNKYQSVE
jgi:aryl-alcohol dehydrogenase-like predicted oxidoreductase